MEMVAHAHKAAPAVGRCYCDTPARQKSTKTQQTQTSQTDTRLKFSILTTYERDIGHHDNWEEKYCTVGYFVLLLHDVTYHPKQTLVAHVT